MRHSEKDKACDRRAQQKTEALRPLLTPKLLTVLVEAAKVHGHSGDFRETSSFVQWCHDVAGLDSAAYDFAELL